MVLAVDALSITYTTSAGPAPAVRSVSLTLGRGETLGIVGESGSGKSTLAHALIGYLAPQAQRTAGCVLFRGEDLLAMSGPKLAAIRGRCIAMVHQNPQATLNPALKVGTQIAEVFVHHAGLSWGDAWARAVESLERVNMADPANAARRYPHELSGGQRQRVSIAIALALDPDVLILDEPTTALDVTTEAVILDLLCDIKRRVGVAIVYISHNLGVIAQMADRVAVMYAGELIEEASVESLFLAPAHPYTRALLACLVEPGASKRTGALAAIPGAIPRLTRLPAGCVFEPRCAYRAPACGTPPPMQEASLNHLVRCVRWKDIPALARLAPPSPATAVDAPGSVLVVAKGLHKSFTERSTVMAAFCGRRVQVVAGVDISLARNRVLGLVGESGSGKTTLLRCLAGLEVADSGNLVVDEKPVAWPVRSRPVSLLRRLQVVFQDPESTLNPKHTVRGNLSRHVRALLRSAPADLARLLEQAMARVRLDPDYLDRYPAELSGGEKQRVAIARAFLGGPDVVLCDEPLSALDVSVQASIVKLLLDLQAEAEVAYLLISHDLAVVRYAADEIAVMYLGRLVEVGPAETFDASPLHPYTEALLSAVSLPDPRKARSRIRLEGPIPSPAAPPSGCVFHTRCPRKLGAICETTVPPWHEGPRGRRYCCHIAPEELKRMQVVADAV